MAKMEQSESQQVQTAVIMKEMEHMKDIAKETNALLKEHIGMFSSYVERHSDKHNEWNTECNKLHTRLTLVEDWKSTVKSKPAFFVSVGAFIVATLVAIWNFLKGG
jgi:hypothetical protein